LEALRKHRENAMAVDDQDAWADDTGEFCNLLHVRRAHIIQDALQYAASDVFRLLYLFNSIL